MGEEEEQEETVAEEATEEEVGHAEQELLCVVESRPIHFLGFHEIVPATHNIAVLMHTPLALRIRTKSNLHISRAFTVFNTANCSAEDPALEQWTTSRWFWDTT